MDGDEFQLLMKARKNVYDLLRCFFLQEPSEPFLQALKEEDILPKLRGYHPDLDEGVDLLSGVIGSSNLPAFLPELQSEFTRLFLGHFHVPLYESVYRSKAVSVMPEETLAVRQKYMEAGLLVRPDRSFPDDHIGAELEFVFYLCESALQARKTDQKKRLLGMQDKFLGEHLVLWVSPLCDRLLAEAKSAYFKGVAKMTKGFVVWDYQEILSPFIDSFLSGQP